jgi:Uma2 family endonuclease
MASERLMTVEEYERIAPYLDGPSELVDGRLRLMSPMGFLHGVFANRIGGALDRYVEEHPEAGEATGAETGFRIDNPQHPVQAPDAAFVSASRVPVSTGSGRDDPALRFMHGAPDLAVEVRSPDDTIEEMQAKARRWLAAGSREVWLVDGLRSTVEVWRSAAAPTLLHIGDTLLAPNVLPGFSLDLARLFRRR